MGTTLSCEAAFRRKSRRVSLSHRLRVVMRLACVSIRARPGRGLCRSRSTLDQSWS